LRIALLSDVHGNLPAFRAVLADVESTGAEQVLCLGDLVGYGAQPDGCVALARERCDVCLAGNHDLVVTGAIDIADFSPSAASAAVWTREHISAESLEYLRGLEPVGSVGEIGLYHASPRDPVWEYVLSEEAAGESFGRTSAPLVLVGHSHIALELSNGRELRGGQAPAGTRLELGSVRRLLNPGSVGQPRDGDARAAWLEIDDEAGWATFRRTEYPVERTQAEMRDVGLPEVLAARLAHGL
jgi:diadenosine tetraphosphatase ApaH/serine/threonine PP2A family protein phosphatase